MPASDLAARPRRTTILATLTILALSASLATPQANAQLACNTTCTGATGTGMTCTVTVMCPVFSPYFCAFASEMIVGSMNAGCNLGPPTADGAAMATHTPSQATPASCSFFFGINCGVTNCTETSTLTDTCVVNAGDGLPIELMEFSIETEHDATREEAGDSDPSED